jgi:hypothetical protein
MNDCHGILRNKQAEHARFVRLLMKNTPWIPEKDPPVKLSNKVRVISPTSDLGKEGIVVEVLEPLGDLIYRYRVRFGDGTVGKFFRFELELVA